MKGELLVYQSFIPGVTNINSDRMCNASSGLCINLCYIILYYLRGSHLGVLYYADPFFKLHLGV